MADYYPLLARALEGLAEPNREARQEVYQRAKAALLAQLRAIEPPLSEAEIARERTSLDEAIGRVERQFGTHEPGREAVPRPSPPGRPRPESTPPIRRGGRRNRSALVAAGILAVVAPIAVLAWLWRDQPKGPVPSEPPRSGTPQPAAGDPKYPERMGGEGRDPVPQPAEAPARPADAPAPATPATPAAPAAEAPPKAAPGQPDLAVAQRAVLYEENTSDPQQPKVTSGRAFWRLDARNAGQGQPLETVVVSNIEFPEVNLAMEMTLRANRDPALPASHTIELKFTTSGEGRAVRDVGLPLMRTSETDLGVQLAGLPVPVKENVFLIALSSPTDPARNTRPLQERNWVDLSIRFASGLRAKLIFEKGVSGERVMAEAFKLWAQS